MLDARAAKSNGGVFFHGEEGVGTQMVSRNLLCVLMLAASISASTQELAGFCSSICSWPRSVLKLPLVVVTDMTRIANDTCEWVGSISQVMIILLEQLFLRKSSLTNRSIPNRLQPGNSR